MSQVHRLSTAVEEFGLCLQIHVKTTFAMAGVIKDAEEVYSSHVWTLWYIGDDLAPRLNPAVNKYMPPDSVSKANDSAETIPKAREMAW